MKPVFNLLFLGALAARLPYLQAQPYSESAAKASAAGVVTYSREIAPILYENCTTCHHQGGAGPFALLTYADARRWAPQILAVTQSRFMPPWLPAPGFGDFADSRRLPDRDLALIRRWVTSGMPQGNPADAPAAPSYSSTWQLGQPDLVLSVAQPFSVPAGGPDAFRNFVLPYPLLQTRYIRALEILPGSPQVVHHANILIDRTASLRRTHPANWQLGIPGMELNVDAGDSFDPDGHFLFWKPDTPALIEPPGMPWRLDPGNDLVLNVHFKPTGKPETAQPKIGLYFTDHPPTRYPMLIQLEHDAALDIPAGAPEFIAEDHLTLPVGVQVLGIYPHAHYIGKDLQGYAVLPNGQKKWLVWIRDWDIDRQAVYRYREPLFLPPGTVLHMRYTYDNSARNPRNPHSPPIRVRAGNQSTDEMGHLWLQVLPMGGAPSGADPASEDPRLALERAWMKNNLRKDPGDPIALYNLAAVDTAEHEYAPAIAAYRALLKQSPQDPRTLTALGAACEGAGDLSAARQAYSAAIAIDPARTEARFDLGRLDLTQERYPEAENQFRQLVAANPEDSAARSGLGLALFRENRTEDAAFQFKQALAVNPHDATALAGLGQLALAANDPARAVPLLEAALAVHDDADTRSSLAFSLAQSGRPADAAAQLEQVLRSRSGDAATHAVLSQVYASMDRLPDAIREQQRALDLAPSDPDGWNNLGVYQLRLGHTPEAREAFSHALRLDPAHAQARANLARLTPQASH